MSGTKYNEVQRRKWGDEAVVEGIVTTTIVMGQTRKENTVPIDRVIKLVRRFAALE